ncbi:MAG: DUF4928 family protein [Nitrospinae bacterium]|nr:DUF4928 family protein [Nitrospinota bacterium]
MPQENKSIEAFKEWFQSLRKFGGFQSKGTISGALVVLERLEKDFNLDIDAHTAKGGAQIIGASGASVKRILGKFGETRRFVSEGGRTNRGLRGDINGMLMAIKGLNLNKVSLEKRTAVLEDFQEFLVNKVREFHNIQRLKIIYEPSKNTSQSISDLLNLAKENGKHGPVAQYLVGAKLAIRFPTLEIGNESFSTADQQLNRQGDFLIGNTVFHVTVSPMLGVCEKCKKNIEEGFRVYLLVPYEKMEAAKQMLSDSGVSEKIAIQSIELFVGQNIDELTTFSQEKLSGEFRLLLETYNQRVGAVEMDKSMMVEIPPNLH